jgi:hypothetical protein
MNIAVFLFEQTGRIVEQGTCFIVDKDYINVIIRENEFDQIRIILMGR